MSLRYLVDNGEWQNQSFEERIESLSRLSEVIAGWLSVVKFEFGHSEAGLALLTKKEAAKLLHVSEPTFSRMVATDPRLPRYKVGASLRFNKAALLEYLIEASKDWTSHMDMLEGMTM
jgi:excisionase family DNA binding protein